MSSEYYKNGFTVKPKSRENITKLADKLRQIWKITGHCDVISILEFAWCNFQVESKYIMGNNLGITRPDGTILLREDVYEGACNNEGFHRFTVAHELGHVILHKDQIGFARAFEHNDKVYCNSEWQANEFAGALLVPENEIISQNLFNPYLIADKYAVSLECAQTRLKKIRG